MRLDTLCCFVLHLSSTVTVGLDTWCCFASTSEFDCGVGHLVLLLFYI